MHATKAAVEEGVVPGGGSALLFAARSLDKLTPANPDQKVGIDIVRKALQMPARLIAENSGTDGSIIVGKLMDSKDANYGYDTQKGEFTDMIQAGIIDPTKVVRHALQDAASVAGLLVTTEAMVAEKPEPKGQPGMGFRQAAAWAAWISEPGPPVANTARPRETAGGRFFCRPTIVARRTRRAACRDRRRSSRPPLADHHRRRLVLPLITLGITLASATPQPFDRCH